MLDHVAGILALLTDDSLAAIHADAGATPGRRFLRGRSPGCRREKLAALARLDSQQWPGSR